jgi:hypothetical protein
MLLLSSKQSSVRHLYRLPSSPQHYNDRIVQKKKDISKNCCIRLRSLKFVSPTVEL